MDSILRHQLIHKFIVCNLTIMVAVESIVKETQLRSSWVVQVFSKNVVQTFLGQVVTAFGV